MRVVKLIPCLVQKEASGLQGCVHLSVDEQAQVDVSEHHHDYVMITLFGVRARFIHSLDVLEHIN